MSSNEQPLVPAASEPGLPMAVREGSHWLALPPSTKLDLPQRRDVDLQEGISPAAIREVYQPARRSWYELLLLMAAAGIAAIILWALFPWGRFFRPRPEKLGRDLAVTVLTPDDVAKRGGIRKLTPQERAIAEITRRLQRGDFTGVADICEDTLNEVDPREWRDWEPIWGHYLRALYILGRDEKLQNEARWLLDKVPENLDARYYWSSLLVRDLPRVPGRRDREAWRDCATRAADLMEHAVKTIEEMAKFPDETRDEKAFAQRSKQFRLLLAEAHMKAWWAGGYQEDDHPDVDDHRDRALDILEGLGNVEEALKMRRDILNDILYRWWFFERAQRYRGVAQKRSVAQADLKHVEEALNTLKAHRP
jgi:hypothetical protein